MSPAHLRQHLEEALAHHRAGRLDRAARLYQRVQAAAPRNFDARHLLGVIAVQEGRAAEAITLLTGALQLAPRHVSCRLRLGMALMAAGRAKDAEPHFRRALDLQPDSAEGWGCLAHCLKVQDRIGEALRCDERCVELDPKVAVSWHNYGLTLAFENRLEEALRCHDRSLEVDPGYARGHFGRGQALQRMHRVPEAIAAYDTFLAREPGNSDARSYRLLGFHYLDEVSRERLFAEHVDFGRATGVFPRPGFPNAPAPGRRLRLAVLSPDLRSHACAYFLEPLLRHLDPAAFEVVLYHDHFLVDAVSRRLQAQAALWRNFVGQPNEAVEAAIRADRPDILIDLAGHTGMTSRLPLFARHLAPVQVTYLGYPDTTGLPAMGYRFTDSIADPAGEADAWATEKLVRFAPTAWSYQASANAPAVVPPPAAAAAAAPVVFGCFNSLAKITDRMLAVWSRVLAAVPDSRLLLKGGGLESPALQQTWRTRLAAHGIPPERVDLAGRTAGADEHLAVYHRVDIALDTFPYHGTTTTCEALWMGRPVVTLRGDRHSSRVGASLLTAVGHPEWIAADADGYVAIATGLAADRPRLAGTSAALRPQLAASVLCDHAGQAARFGAALRACWTEWCGGVQPSPTDQATGTFSHAEALSV